MRAIDDPAVLAEAAAIFRRAHDRKASRSATLPASSGTAGKPNPSPGLPGTFPNQDRQVASAGQPNA